MIMHQSLLTALAFQPSNPPPEKSYHASMTTLQKWASLDWIGGILSLASIVCLLLPLQWGGVTKPVSSYILSYGELTLLV